MKISCNTIELPFKVGDTVFVNKRHEAYLPGKQGVGYAYFEGEVVRIFLDGRLEELTVITEPIDSFDLEIRTVVYEVKPVGKYTDLVRMPLILSLPIKEPVLFRSEVDLLDYQRTLSQIDAEMSKNAATPEGTAGEPS